MSRTFTNPGKGMRSRVSATGEGVTALATAATAVSRARGTASFAARLGRPGRLGGVHVLPLPGRRSPGPWPRPPIHQSALSSAAPSACGFGVQYICPVHHRAGDAFHPEVEAGAVREAAEPEVLELIEGRLVGDTVNERDVWHVYFPPQMTTHVDGYSAQSDCGDHCMLRKISVRRSRADAFAAVRKPAVSWARHRERRLDCRRAPHRRCAKVREGAGEKATRRSTKMTTALERLARLREFNARVRSADKPLGEESLEAAARGGELETAMTDDAVENQVALESIVMRSQRPVLANQGRPSAELDFVRRGARQRNLGTRLRGREAVAGRGTAPSGESISRAAPRLGRHRLARATASWSPIATLRMSLRRKGDGFTFQIGDAGR